VSNRAVLALSATLATLASLLVFASSASATAVPRGSVGSATQSARTVTITGWAYDPARRSSSVRMKVYLDGKYAGTRVTTRLNRHVNRVLHASGRHSFRSVLHVSRTVHTVQLRVLSARAHRWVSVASARVGQQAAAGARIVTAARKYYRARTPYVEGGSTPRGFDCSGYTQYVYREARVSTLPRTAEQQRRSVRHVSRANARPGDLVFYLSGGSAFHVAIYAGHGMQYAEATVRDGLRYQPVWSSAVQYGTTWH
jgi:cell wall-associated NlpC family hydrolase